MKSARLDLRVDPDLKARVEAAAAERGQTLTVFAERALESALNEGPLGVTAESPRAEVPSAPSRTPAKPAFNRVSTLKR